MTTSATTSPQARIAAKQALRTALAHHNGDPGHPAVAAAIARLALLNPTAAPAQSAALIGDWRLISAPIFPDGKLRADGTYAYTLGRLAFNMFRPRRLLLVIDQVAQPVWPITGTKQQTHDIVVNFTTLGDTYPATSGIVRNLGVCEPMSDTALQVKFTGGTLEPASGTDLQQWRQVFDQPETDHHFSPKAWLQGLFLKWLFGLVPPQGMNPENGHLEFQMQRSPKGTLEIVYLDEELRITRGQKETVLVCERC